MWFVLVLALTVAILYFVSYENWVREVGDNSPAEIISTTATTTSTPAVTAIETPAKTLKENLLSPWKKVMTTYFYVGEPADADNAFITNTASYWDEKWQQHFGGVDTPGCRNGYRPCAFTPKENPFYFALPYAEYDPAGNLKSSVTKIPWYKKDSLQLLKNRWIAVRHGETTCYGQWEDVGPNGEDDFAYVFDSKEPVNTFGAHAGLDVSPALWKCLQMKDNDQTEWAFIDASDVPAGPWKDIVTTSGTSWGN